MKHFESCEDARRYADECLGKQYTEVVLVGTDKVLLCGTPQIEDAMTHELVPAVIDAIKSLTGEELSFEDVFGDGDVNAAIVDVVETALSNLLGMRIVYGTTEY